MLNGNVVILGASGGVGKVVVQKCSQAPHMFGRIIGASRDTGKYAEINKLLARPIEARRVDASSEEQLVALLERTRPDLLLNVGIPYWNLNAMRACLRFFKKTKQRTHYLDTACWEPENEARFRHDEQWSFFDDFKESGLTAIVGCGFDPGITNAMVAYAYKHFFARIDKVQIWDCNGGSHGKAIATNFNLVINLRELLGPVRYRLNGQWQDAPSLIDDNAMHFPYHFEEIGERELYLMYHEELESLAKNFPQIGEMSFWMTFGPQYIRYLRMFKETGLASIHKIGWTKQAISPLEFIERVVPEQLIHKHEALLRDAGLMSEKLVPIPWDEELPWDEPMMLSPLEILQIFLPEPSTLGKRYTGKTNIGLIIEGIGFDGRPLRWRMFNICDHPKCWLETKSQAISYTTGVPAMAGAMMIITGKWLKPGVWNVEQLAPDPFILAVEDYGLLMQRQFGSAVPKAYEFAKAA